MTNPTERPEERPRFKHKFYLPPGDHIIISEPWQVSGDLCLIGYPVRREAPMTEQPEERDSLSVIEERLDNAYDIGTMNDDIDTAIADIRTLINEVKDNHRLFDEANDRMFADGLRLAALEAEVKELREENERLKLENRQASIERRTRPEPARIKQMEEALREQTDRADGLEAGAGIFRQQRDEQREVLELTRSRLSGRTDFYGLWKRIDDVLRGVKV